MQIRHVTVIEPAERTVTHDRLIRVENERIAAIEPDDDAPLDAGDLDGADLFALPGLIHCHVHLCAYTADEYAWSQASPSYVAATTAAEMRATPRVAGFWRLR